MEWKEAKISSGLAYISLFAAAEGSEGLRRPAVQVTMLVFYFVCFCLFEHPGHGELLRRRLERNESEQEVVNRRTEEKVTLTESDSIACLF